jgi:hypothetical protein
VDFRAFALAVAVAAAAAAPSLVRAAPQDIDPPAAPAGTHFKCQEGGDLVARFDTRGPGLVAVVDAGEGPHALPIRPWAAGGPVRLTWSDGQRTLTWSPGVQIMWMDGGAHRMCGREGHHH